MIVIVISILYVVSLDGNDLDMGGIVTGMSGMEYMASLPQYKAAIEEQRRWSAMRSSWCAAVSSSTTMRMMTMAATATSVTDTASQGAPTAFHGPL